ncbi:MAG: hypothetical protein IJK98_11060, partial [Clostridia bacterium]|nr:hypothetical protein [Clostridia bacterium]
LPQTFTAKDIFYYANRIIGPSYWYLHHLAALTVAFAVASLLFFILTLLLAGHVRNESAPLARGLHRLPYDLVCAVVFTMAVSLLVQLLDDLPYSNPVPYIVAASALVLTLMLFIETTVVCCKAKTIGKNFLVVKLFSLLIRVLKKLKTLLLKASANMNLLWKLGLLFGVTVVAGFVYSLLLTEEEEFIFLWVVVKILEIPLLLWLAACWNRLQNGARNLSEGHISEKVDTNHLFGELKKNADYLNAISEGVNKEVRERMKSESMKTELITNVSHDLKTPLTSIINYVDLLKGTDVTDPKAREYIDVIDRQSQRLKKLCADVVDASKAATGAMHVTKEPTTLNVMLTQAVGEYDERLKARRLQLVAEIPAEPISVNADGKLLWRVFDNLMNNICQYAMEGTRVYLTLSARDGAASVMFRNISGAALNITPEDAPELAALCAVPEGPLDAAAVENRVLCGDCFALAPRIAEGLFDLVIADPPYNLTKDYGGEVFSKTNEDAYEAFTERWVKEVRRLMKPGATLYVCCDWESSLTVGAVLKRHFTVRSRITWQREKGRGAKKNWKNAMEDIWFCTLGDGYQFHLDAVKVRKKVIAPYRENGEAKDWQETDGGKYRMTCPSNFWDDVTVPFWSMAENT